MPQAKTPNYLQIFSDGPAPTKRDTERRKALAKKLSDSETPKVYSTGQGLLTFAGKAFGGYMDAKADRDETKAEEDAWSPIQKMIDGQAAEDGDNGNAGSDALTGSAGNDRLYEGTGDYSAAIAGIESGGRYDAVGPQHAKYGKPLGKYQVMEANIGKAGTWDNEALGRDVSSQEFLSNPQMQEAVFKTKFGQYARKYGPEGAASMWHSGRPTPGNRQDSLGTKTSDYVSKFSRALGRSPSVAGGTGQDQLRGGAGDDQITGQGGDEVLSGGSGADQGGNGAYSLPAPDLSMYRKQAQMGQAMMRNPRTRAAGYQMWQQAMQGAQKETAQHRQLQMEYGLKDQEARRKQAAEDGKPIIVGKRAFMKQKDGTFKEVISSPESGENEIVLPDGTTVRTGGGKKTELNAKYGQFYQRGTAANADLEATEGALTKGETYIKEYGPQVASDYFNSDEYKMARQAADNFLVTIIRPDTGAAVTDKEFQIYGGIFLPRPGDPPALILQKRQTREKALEALKQGMTPEQVLQFAVPDQFDGKSTVPKALQRRGPEASKYVKGYKEDGYTFQGGDPKDPKAWTKD